ncbi:hypothetical protein niasHT_039041 [Heterodera trifolii]|uniref:B30.2/SPRY domain-containing protein n=1 Tax=Heterodera trifolii TaxID=157864 RepID=A0ABD2HU76_9BILA
MSFATESTNSGDFSSDDCEMNYDEFSLVKEGAVVKTNGESLTDQQKLKLKNKGLQEKLKQQETNSLLAKIEAENGKMKNEIEKMQAKLDEKEEQLEELQKKMLKVKCDSEEENNGKLKNEQKEMKEKQKAFQEEHEEKLMEQIKTLQAKISKMEMEHQKQKVYIGQMEQLQNEQKKKTNALEKNQLKMALRNFRQNRWDANACHYDIQIVTNNQLAVYCYEGTNCGYRTVFATHPILLGKNSSEIFYFEIPNPYGVLTFGFAIKQQDKLEGAIANDFGTYAYLSGGDFTVNGEWKIQKEDYSVGREDTVGCGINLATRQIFFTKNGWILASYDLVDHSPFFDVPDELFPFLSLMCSGEEIEANFGPKFAFDLAKPKQWKKAIISSN